MRTWFRNMAIGRRLPLAIGLLLTLAVATLSVASYVMSRALITEQAAQNLKGVAHGQAKQVKTLLDTIDNEIKARATTPSTARILTALSDAYKTTENPTDTLQRVYITENPEPLGQKDNLIAATTGSSYGFLHRTHHPGLRLLQQQMGYYDIFLINNDGDIVYSVFKENDFATNLLTGEWADTGLGDAFRQASELDQEAASVFVDFAPYPPSAQSPAAFIARPIILDNGERLGVLAYQMPVGAINAAMRDLASLPESADGFLVGSDGFLRTDSIRSDINDILTTKDGVVAALPRRHRNVPRSWCSTPRAEEDGEMKNMMIGVDLAKNVFQVHGALRTGEVQFRKKLTRKQFPAFMAQQKPGMVIFEACGGAHFWAREMEAHGHEVKLIAPQYVRPFVKRQKNDAADAEAIVIAARQPEMRFVDPKTVEQQSCAAVFRGRERLVHQRTADVNALRALLYEHGYVFPVGMSHLNRMTALVEDETVNLHALIREECLDLLVQIAEKTARIIERTTKLKTLAAQSDRARRLQTMPGVGPLTAIAVEAFGPDMAQFKTGRDFAAWLGLVPKQHSSGGKERLGRMTKAGQADIRRLLIIGAMSRLNWLGQRTIVEGSWLSRMLTRKPKMLVAIALANKMARQIWAMLTKNEDYRDPAMAVVA